MQPYTVTVRRTMETTVTVEAESIHSAHRIALEQPLTFDPDTARDTVVRVRPAKETKDAE